MRNHVEYRLGDADATRTNMMPPIATLAATMATYRPIASFLNATIQIDAIMLASACGTTKPS